MRIAAISVQWTARARVIRAMPAAASAISASTQASASPPIAAERQSKPAAAVVTIRGAWETARRPTAALGEYGTAEVWPSRRSGLRRSRG
jgi:pyrroline-5-carboxylate reductase